MPSPVLRVRLLGGVDLRLGDVPLAPLESARAESLLTFLLLHADAAHPRQRLAFMLWPDSTEAQARTNLRHVLHTLRRALPDPDRFIEVGARALRWRPDAPLWLDVAAFEGALAEGRLADAVGLYRGDLLEGVYDDWLLEERERLAALHAEALERLARELEARGRPREAIRHAEALQRRDPLREETYRLLMRLHDACGDGARAVRAYHQCAATLRRELGLEPSPATRQAYEALLRTPSDGSEGHAGPPEPGRPPLVGRARERAGLTAIWRAAEAGSARLVLVTGEPGVGKSRLVEELQAWCAHRGAVTAEARAYAAEGPMAYGLLIAWLRSQALGARLARLAPADLTELARLLPELLQTVPGLPAPEPLSPPEQRRRLFEAAARSVLAAGTPLLLVADDLQWCDEETLAFLHYLIRSHAEQRLLVAATARLEEVADRAPAGELLRALGALGRLDQIALERLGREETRVLGERIAGRPLGEQEAERLFADSEGNPLFVVEALRASGEGGRGGGSRVEAVIGARLARLSEPAAELAGLAATIGREFTARVVEEASGAGERELVRGLDELWRRGVVRERGADAYDFSHGRIREAAYRALSPAQARRHHLRVAGALARVHAGDPDAVAGQVAAHYDRAGAPADAVAWYARAADAAQRLHAHAEAVRVLERALELARRLGPAGGGPDAELRLLSALPGPLVALEGYLSERVAEAHRRALELGAALGAEPEPPLVRSLALASLARGDFTAARAFGRRLRTRGERDGDDVLVVEGAYVLGVAAYWSGRLAAARTHLEAAVRGARPELRGAHLLRYGQDPEVVCGSRLAHTLWLLGEEAAAARARDGALALARGRGHPYSRALATIWAALMALDQGDDDALRGHAQALGSEPLEAAMQNRLAARVFAGYLAVCGGGGEEGVAAVRGVIADVRDGEPPAPGMHAVLMRVLVGALARAGEARRGLEAADEALAMGGATALWEPEFRRLRAEFLRALGAGDAEVRAELARALDAAARQGARSVERRVRASMGAPGETPQERSRNGARATMPPEADDDRRADTPD